jgi:ABC-type transporter MlaC component
MTPEQQGRYDKLVPVFVADEFGNRIDELAVQNPQIGAVTMRGSSEARVASEFRRKRDKSLVKVDWRLGRAAGGWKLLDVYVNGVSRLIIRRGEFSAIVDRQGMEALLKYMESRPN